MTVRIRNTALAVLTGFATTGVAEAADYTMKIGYVTINDPFDDFAALVETEIETRSEGRIEVELYPAAQLGLAARQIEALQIGTQEVFIAPPGFLAGINSGMQVLDVPGVFYTMDHAQSVLSDDAIQNTFSDLLAPAGIQTLSLWAYGPSTVATVEPIEGIDDLEGLKVRVLASPLEQELARELGMTGVAMDFTEALPALQNGTIDGVRTAMSVMGGMKFYDTARYALKEETGMILGGAFASTLWMDSLPEDLRAMVEETFLTMRSDALDVAKAAVEASNAEWEDAGVTIVELDEEERAALFERVQPIGERFLADDPQAGPIWTVLKETLERHPPE